MPALPLEAAEETHNIDPVALRDRSRSKSSDTQGDHPS
jgi:hypothetical protein